MFSRREYEYVMEIAKEGSFSKAAQKLYVSQPALSGAIKKLEKDLYGIPLFDRAVTPVALTPAGQYYLEQARKIYELRNEIEHHFADLAGIRTGIINIGTSGYFLSRNVKNSCSNRVIWSTSTSSRYFPVATYSVITWYSTGIG